MLRMITRTPIGTASPALLEDVKRRARLTHDDEDMDVQALADAAAAEIERTAEIALLAQVVTVTLTSWCNRIALPVGPFWPEGLAAHPLTVELIDDAGNITPHHAGWWIEPGRNPKLNLTASGAAWQAIRIRYPAGYGMGADSIPADLQLAICDHAAMLYDARGMTDAPQGLSLAASRITARYRGVAL